MTYDGMRHFADSWGLLAMGILFLILVLWPFRRGAAERNRAAARMIFEDDENG